METDIGENVDDAHSDLGYGAAADGSAPPEPQAAAKLVPHGEFSAEYEKYVDFAIGARTDAASFYLHGNVEAGVRMRAATVTLEKYGKWLRMDSIAVAKEIERPPAFDWSGS